MIKKIFNLRKTLITLALSLTTIACQSNVQKPSIVPAIEIKKQTTHSLGVIGEVEPIYILPMKSPFLARIDTGATNSSVDVEKMKNFERDGEKWVAFTITNRETKETHRFERPIIKETTIRRIEDNEKRPVVMLDIKIGPELVNTKVSLANRDKFDYQTLIGRNVLTGRAIVDTSLSNTLY